MDLKTANKMLEKLENDYNYWLNEKEKILPLVRPQTSIIKDTIVDGGTRMDRLAKYVELEDEKKINDTLDYINKRIRNLSRWVEEELRIINKYEPLEQKIIMLRNEKHLKWKDISISTGYCVRQCQRIYDKYYKRTKGTRNNFKKIKMSH